MKKKCFQRISAALLSIGLLHCFPVSVSQIANAAADKTITLVCRQNDTILSGMDWKLYRIGTREENIIHFIPELSEYSLDLGDLSSSAVDTAAKTLESYVVAAGLPVLSEGKTNESGELQFDGLESGLYLAIGTDLQIGEIVYFPSTLLLEVNGRNTNLNYDAYPKFYSETLSDQTTAYIVKKVWVNDENAGEARPESITADIYQDGVLYDSVTLSEENGWKYRWETLDANAKWIVAERDIPEHYEVMVDYNSQQFLIRNSYVEPPVVTTSAAAVTTTVTAPPEKLTQTGQLWWPVIPLSIGGILLIAAGISVGQGKKKHEE